MMGVNVIKEHCVQVYVLVKLSARYTECLSIKMEEGIIKILAYLVTPFF